MELEQFFDLFLNTETGFFDVRIAGVNIWKNVRSFVYSILMTEYYNIPWGQRMSETVTLVKKNRGSVLYSLLKKHQLRQFVVNSPFIFDKRDLLCILYPVRVRVGKEDVEKYVDVYYKQIKNYTYHCLEWNLDVCDRAPNPQTKNLKYISDDIIISFFGKELSYNYKKIYKIFENKIMKVLEHEYGIKISNINKKRLYKELVVQYSRRQAYIKYYNFILDQIKPKGIIFYNSWEYYTQILVEVATQRGIKTVEIQHGSFCKQNSIPFVHKSNRKISTVPDYLFTFSEYYNSFFVGNGSKPLSVGRTDLLDKPLQNRKVERRVAERTRILIISSCDNTIEKCQCLMNQTHLYEITVKLHPIEWNDWKTRYPQLIDTRNVKIVGKTSRDIGYYLSRADIIIGGVSTVLEEAFLYPCMKITLNAASKDLFVQAAVDRGYYYYAEKEEQLLQLVGKYDIGEIILKDPYREDYLICRDAHDKMDKVLEQIL